MGTAFETEMGVLPEISSAVAEMDWILPTDIQSESVPLILGGGDVLMAAETGSGKTGAFSIPVVQVVYETIKDVQEGKCHAKSSKNSASGSNNGKLNLYDRSAAFAIDADGVTCQCREPRAWHGSRCNKAVKNSGKYFYEVTISDNGLCRVGWSTINASYDVGTDNKSYGFGGTGKKSHNRQFDNYGESFGIHDVIGCSLNLDNGTISYYKNGVSLGVAFNIEKNFVSTGLYPSVCVKNAELKFNFGSESFQYPIPNGYMPFDSAPEKNIIVSKRGNVEVQEKFTLKPNAPLAIVIEPSRELAEQTYGQLIKFGSKLVDPPLRYALLIGGSNTREQKDQLNKGVDIVVATPGRLDDFITNQGLELDHCRFFVLDECDALLSAGYTQMIDRLHAAMPKVTPDGKRLQMIVCSATLHSFDVKKLATRLMHFPTWVDLKGQDSVPETVHHVICHVDPSDDLTWQRLMGDRNAIRTDGVHKQDPLQSSSHTPEVLSEAVKLLKGEYIVRAIKQQRMDRALIFCRTKLDCDNLEKKFINLGGGPNRPKTEFSCVCLHSDRSTQERKSNLHKFKSEDVRFLICTDVAARGIDISGLPYVINMTLPDEKQNYVHRIGRVGRAERMGLAISLVSNVKEKVWYHSNCSSRGKGCYDTRLTTSGGCCIWYNEKQLLGDIEEHLGVTIDEVSRELRVQADAFDGKVVYGQKFKQGGSKYASHVDELSASVKALHNLERKSQRSFLELRHNGLISC